MEAEKQKKAAEAANKPREEVKKPVKRYILIHSFP